MKRYFTSPSSTTQNVIDEHVENEFFKAVKSGND